MNDSQVTEYKSIFDEYDRDKNGRITIDELKRFVLQVGGKSTISASDLVEILMNGDIDQDGSISFIEFLAMMGYRKGEVQLLALFKEFDADRSGFITPMELKRGFAVYGKKLTHKEVQNLFAEVDQDGDGKINFEEFVKLMQD